MDDVKRPESVDPRKVIAAKRAQLCAQIGHVATEVRRLTDELHKLEADIDALDKVSHLL